MGKTLAFLGTDWVDREIQRLDAHLLGAKKPLVARGAMKQAAPKARPLLRWLKNMDRTERSPKETLDLEIGSRIERAELAFVRGEEPELVRARYRAIAEPWEAIFAKIDWKRKAKSIDCESRRAADKWAAKFKGRVVGKGANLRVRYTELPQPYDAKEILQCAAISGDKRLGETLAKLYRVQTPTEAEADGDVGFCVLRELMAGRDDIAAEHAKNLPTGYPHDWGPERVELPIGILKADSKMVLRGVKAISTRFKTAWDLKRIRSRYDQYVSKFAKYKNEKNAPAWEMFFDKARRETVGMKWIQSTWALSFLNIAAWRGMTDIFDDKSAFSEWVPLELCKPL